MKSVNKIFLQIIKFFIIIMFIILLLETLLRISDRNCYSFLPIYFEKEHSTLIKNDSFCVKYTGHPKSTYKTNKYGMRIHNNETDKTNNKNLLIGDSQAMGYGINFNDHFLYKYLQNNNLGNLEILAAPHNDLESISSFVKINNFNFNEYKKIFIMFNLGVDLDRFVFGWQDNWNISNSYKEIQLSKMLRIYPYIKNIYLKFKKYHFTFRPSINPYLDYLSDQEINYLISEIMIQYFSFINKNEIINYEFIIIAPAWYIDKKQINKYEHYYSKSEFDNLKKNYYYYEKSLDKHLDFFRKAFKNNNVRYKLIDKNIYYGTDLFQSNNYHLNISGHKKISDAL